MAPGVFKLLILMIALALVTSEVSFASGSGITYQGRILKPDGTPLSGATTQFKLQIRSGDTAACLMYEELQGGDLRNTNGTFSLTLNDGTGSRVDSTGLTLDQIFANRGTLHLDSTTCSTGTGAYSPSASDGRVLTVWFKDETMSTWEPIPPQKINFVPFAFEAKQIAGFTADSLLRVANAGGDPLTGLSPLSNAQYTELLALVNGTTTQYSKAGQLGGVAIPATSSLSNGQVLSWNGSTWVGTSVVGGASSVTSSMIASGAVGSGALAAGAVGTSAIANNVSINTSGSVGARDIKIYPAGSGTGFVEMQASPSIADGSSYLLKWPATAGSPNQVLTTDGYGVLSWAAPTVSSQWTTHGSDVSYDGGGNVGIGTTAPLSALDVVGNAMVRKTDADVAFTLQNNSSTTARNVQINVINHLTGFSGSSVLNLETRGGTSAAPTAISSGTALGYVNFAGSDGASTGQIGGLVQSKAVEAWSSTAHGTRVSIATTPAGTTGYPQPQMTVDSTGYVAIGSNFISPGSSLSIKGTTANSSASSMNIMNSSASSLLFVRNDGNVGIGTTSPGYKLDVAGVVNATAVKVNGVDVPTSGGAGGGQTSTTALTYNSNSDASGSDGGFNFQSSGSTLFSLANNGDANFSSSTASTSSSTGAVKVAGGMGVTGNIYSGASVNAATSVAAGTTITAGTSLTVPQIYGKSAASGDVKIDGTSNSTAGNVLLATAGGNVGIGTTSPSSMLTVAGVLTLTGVSSTITSPSAQLLLQQTGDTYGASSLALQNRIGSNGILVSNSGVDVVDLGLKPLTGPQGVMRLEHRPTMLSFPANISGELQWVDSAISGSPITPMNIGTATTLFTSQSNSGGFVVNRNSTSVGDYSSLLLGTTSLPGSGYVKGGLFFQRTSTGGMGNLLFANRGTTDATPVSPADTAMTIAANGLVGIGTTAPAQTLDIFSSGSTNVGVTSDGTSAWMPGYASTFYKGTGGAGTGYPRYLSRLARGSKVAPTALVPGEYILDFEASGTFDTSGAFAVGSSIQAKTSGTWSPGYYPTVLTFNSVNTGSMNSAGETMRLDPSGNVGIGTTAPTAALHLKAGAAAAGQAPLKFTQGTLLTAVEDGAMEYNSSGLWFTIGSTRYVIPTNTAAGNFSNVSTISNASGGIAMSPMGSNAVVISSTATSTSPVTGGLVVSGGVGVTGAINASSNISSGGSVTATTSVYTPQLFGGSGASANIKIDGADNATKGNVLLASTGGNVGIGTTAPQHRLDVSGDAYVTGALNVGYLFAPNVPSFQYIGSSGGTAGYWTRIAQVNLVAQYQGYFARFSVASGNVAAKGVNASVYFRAKQQAAMGSAPVVNVELDSSNSILKLADVAAVTTVNSSAQTVVELWVRVNTDYDTLAAAPTVATGWFDSVNLTPSPLQAALPSGTQTLSSSGQTRFSPAANTNDIAFTGGNVCIGTTSPTGLFDLQANTTLGSSTLLQRWDWSGNVTSYDLGLTQRVSSGNVAYDWAMNLNSATATNVMTFQGGNVGIGTTAPGQKLEVNGSVLASAYLYTSDRRLKTDFQPLDRSLEKLLTLKPTRFRWITPKNPDEDREQIGLIAQDVQAVFPQAVKQDGQGWLRLNYVALIAPIIDAIHSLHDRVDGTDTKVTHVEDRVDALKKQLAETQEKNRALEARLDKLERSLKREPAGH